MSFVRVGRPQQNAKGKRPVRAKKTAAAAPKKEWVSTVNDLSVHKLQPAELRRRHEIHKSRNKVAAQWELRERALKQHLRHPGSPAPLDQASLRIIREVFSDQMLLQDVLARSDRAMAVVKDLFGDAPRRQMGHPSVTMAPNCDSDSALPVLQRPDPPTQLSLLSQSMMDQQALNEVEVSDSEYSDDDSSPNGSSSHHLIRRGNLQKMKTKSRGRTSQQQKARRFRSELVDRDHIPVTPSTSGRAPEQAALNATVAVRRVRSRQSQSEENKEEPSVLVSQVLNPEAPPNQSGRVNGLTSRNRKSASQSSELDGSSVSSLSRDQSGLGLLQAMLGQVEADLDSLRPESEPASAQGQNRNQGLTGFSVALVSTLGRVVNILKQKEEEAKNEAQERRRLEEEVKEQRGLIDALTAEAMSLREEAAALQASLQQQTAELQEKLDMVVLAMGGLGPLDTYVVPHQGSDVKITAFQSAPVAERDLEHVCVAPAVLLSPPRQSDNWQLSPTDHPAELHHDPPHPDVLRPCESVQPRSSPSSLGSLPLSSLPSTSSLSLTSDPLGTRLSPEAILAEIAELSRQNELIKAQLSQARSLGSAGRESPSSSSSSSRSSQGQRRSSSGSTGRLTVQSVKDRRTSASSSTERGSHRVQAEREQPAQQAASSSSSRALSIDGVEQRLQELNRQSAAARGRLLQLIEQQKQSVSAKAAPADSPIPPSAFSPHSAGGGGSPEESMLLPAHELQTGGGHRQRAGSEVSCHSLRGEAQLSKTQMEQQKETDGWFSLSSHMR